MSEEIAIAAADIATVEGLRARVLEWEDCYDRLAGAFELHMDILECKQALSDYAGMLYDVLIGDLADQRDQLRAALEVAMQENEQRMAVERALRAELEAARQVVTMARSGFGVEEDIRRAYAFDPNALTAAIRAYDVTPRAPAPPEWFWL